MKKRALVTGVTGQDGSYLAELLLSKGYEVYGLVRRPDSIERGTAAVAQLVRQLDQRESLKLVEGDIRDSTALKRIVGEVEPHEVYNLAGQTEVALSFEKPEETTETNALGPLHLLEAIRDTDREIRYFQASSSVVFDGFEISQNEPSQSHTRSPYALSKLFAHWTTINYRVAYGLYAVNAIFFNHESPRRSHHFVSRKITMAAARIKLKIQDRLVLGNLDARRDWGYAREYMEAAWLMLQQAEPDDYLIATGESHSVREFLDEAFGYLDLDWKRYVEIDPQLPRSAGTNAEVGDWSRARRLLGWQPRTTFRELVRIMVDADLAALKVEPRVMDASRIN